MSGLLVAAYVVGWFVTFVVLARSGWLAEADDDFMDGLVTFLASWLWPLLAVLALVIWSAGHLYRVAKGAHNDE